MTALRFFQTGRPSQIGARVLPIDPHEQWALSELRRRREAKQEQAR